MCADSKKSAYSDRNAPHMILFRSHLLLQDNSPLRPQKRNALLGCGLVGKDSLSILPGFQVDSDLNSSYSKMEQGITSRPCYLHAFELCHSSAFDGDSPSMPQLSPCCFLTVKTCTPTTMLEHNCPVPPRYQHLSIQ